MSESLREALKPSSSYSLANAFSRLGWTGFWAQIAIGSIPLVLAIYSFLFDSGGGAGTRGGLALVEYLTIASLLLMAFTTVWFYRYTRLARQIADPERRPQSSVVRRAAWTGVAASTLGVVLSILVMLFEVTQLLFYFLRVPQVGIPTIQTTGSGSASWISAADIVSLLILILTLFVEVAVLTFSLWLLFRTMTASVEYPNAGSEQQAAPTSRDL
jgi:lysylphosphatidylglycerol synthetase-like protein (DUF2156 family)